MGVSLTEDVKFIVMFTVCFVIVGGIIIGAGYVILNFTGILGGNGADASTPTVTPAPTGAPTAAAPTATPAPTKPIIYATATPKPTAEPTPVPTVFNIAINPDSSTRTYWISFTLNTNLGNQFDMSKVVLSVWDGANVYKNYSYDDACFFGGAWTNANGNTLLEPGETFTYKVSSYTLNIPIDTEPKITIVDNGEIIKTVRMPMMQTSSSTPAYGDPGNPSAGDTTTPAYPPDSFFF